MEQDKKAQQKDLIEQQKHRESQQHIGKRSGFLIVLGIVVATLVSVAIAMAGISLIQDFIASPDIIYGTQK